MDVYYETAKTAREHGEIEKFRASHWENIACRNCVEKEISAAFDGLYLKENVLDKVLAQYDAQRVALVLAATVQTHEEDGRYKKATKEWSHTIRLPDDDKGHPNRLYEYCLSTHPCILDGFIEMFRRGTVH